MTIEVEGEGHCLENLGCNEATHAEKSPSSSSCKCKSTMAMAQWRGNLVTEKEAKALCHVFDNLLDYFGQQRSDPQVKFEVSLEHPEIGRAHV